LGRFLHNTGLFCFGLGYSAGFLARSLAREEWRIAGTTREAGAVVAHNWPIHVFSRSRLLADAQAALAGSTHVLLSIPPDEAGDPVLDRHSAALASLPGLQWIGYLSTTGVYGDRHGAWVDEETAPDPAGERGRRRLAAEQGWRALASDHHLPLHIFRLAGIYGPGRSALDAVRLGRAQRIDRLGHVFSRIHVLDLVAVLAASMAHPAPGALYNVCDDEPAPAGDVVSYACALLGVKPPPPVPFETAGLSPLAASFYDDNKRVANRRIKTDLGVRLNYPTYREGLAAILADEGAAPPGTISGLTAARQ
jgi:nucleoside-diphosphate-sugar epimerase